MKGTILILSVILLFGCSPKQDRSDHGKPTVFVSIPPQAGLAKAIVGEAVHVGTLVGEGQSPHAYEPTAKQLAELGNADILFTVGVPFEQALLKKIRPLYPNLRIVETDAGISKRSMPHAHHGEHCTHDHGAPDPHVWLTPENSTMIAGALYTELKAYGIEPTEFEALKSALTNLNDTMVRKLEPFSGSRFYVFHPSFGYFADRYGLKQIPIELEGKAPSPRQLAELIDQAKADQVKIIFVQKQFPSGSADAVAKAIDGHVVYLDPLAEDVIDNLRQISEAIAHSYE